jgi:hypothetical protein
LVNFKNRLAGKQAEKPTDPLKLYETLDRAHDKGPLRPAQIAVLHEWFSRHLGTREVIIKLHTGQGKTLIGLLMLQARLKLATKVNLQPNQVEPDARFGSYWGIDTDPSRVVPEGALPTDAAISADQRELGIGLISMVIE